MSTLDMPRTALFFKGLPVGVQDLSILSAAILMLQAWGHQTVGDLCAIVPHRARSPGCRPKS